MGARERESTRGRERDIKLQKDKKLATCWVFFMLLFSPFWEKIGKAKHQLRVLEVGCGGGAVGRWAGVEIDGE